MENNKYLELAKELGIIKDEEDTTKGCPSLSYSEKQINKIVDERDEMKEITIFLLKQTYCLYKEYLDVKKWAEQKQDNWADAVARANEAECDVVLLQKIIDKLQDNIKRNVYDKSKCEG